MNLIKCEELASYGHDVYELCYNRNYPKHWNVNSIYIASEDVLIFEKYINLVFSDFHFYGPQRVFDYQLNELIELCTNEIPELVTFFKHIKEWRNNDPDKCDYFWIYGI